MDDSEKISGKKIFNILEQLKRNHTIINIHVMGTDFEGLSVILGLSDGEKPTFFIDYPGTSDSFIPISEGNKCYFEFNGEDKIQYSFRTTIDRILGKRIKFFFPEVIERTQRRRAFRISVPSGTKLLYSARGNRFEFDILDISEGGLLAGLKFLHHKKELFFKGVKLYNLSISLTQEDISVMIKVKSVEIIRLENIKERGRFNYGLRFIEIDMENKDVLKRFIYYCQRKVLKKRGGLDD